MPRDIDWNFIAAREGAARQKGYVPQRTVLVPSTVEIPTSSKPIIVTRKEVIGDSGVTVGTGFDIGQRSLYDLKTLKLDAELEKKLSAYVGHYESIGKDGTKKTGINESEVRQNGAKATFVKLTKSDALAALAATPLELTAEEVTQLDKAVKKAHVDELVKKFDADVKQNGAGCSFDSLPRGMQTAIASATFQYGVNMKKSKNANARKLWEYTTSGKFQEASELLKSFGDSYTPRRKLEAGQFDEGLKSLESSSGRSGIANPPTGGMQGPVAPTPQCVPTSPPVGVPFVG